MKLTDLYLKPEEIDILDCKTWGDIKRVCIEASANHAIKKVVEDVVLNCYTIWVETGGEDEEHICLDKAYLEALKKLEEELDKGY